MVKVLARGAEISVVCLEFSLTHGQPKHDFLRASAHSRHTHLHTFCFKKINDHLAHTHRQERDGGRIAPTQKTQPRKTKQRARHTSRAARSIILPLPPSTKEFPPRICDASRTTFSRPSVACTWSARGAMRVVRTCRVRARRVRVTCRVRARRVRVTCGVRVCVCVCVRAEP